MSWRVQHSLLVPSSQAFKRERVERENAFRPSTAPSPEEDALPHAHPYVAVGRFQHLDSSRDGFCTTPFFSFFVKAVCLLLKCYNNKCVSKSHNSTKGPQRLPCPPGGGCSEASRCFKRPPHTRSGACRLPPRLSTRRQRDAGWPLAVAKRRREERLHVFQEDDFAIRARQQTR